MEDISVISIDVLRYLFGEMGYDMAFEMYRILREKFPLCEETKVLVIDFGRLKKAEMNAGGCLRLIRVKPVLLSRSSSKKLKCQMSDTRRKTAGGRSIWVIRKYETSR
jgi:hypothetical protein